MKSEKISDDWGYGPVAPPPWIRYWYILMPDITVTKTRDHENTHETNPLSATA